MTTQRKASARDKVWQLAPPAPPDVAAALHNILATLPPIGNGSRNGHAPGNQPPAVSTAPLLATLLYHRGMQSAEQVETFFLATYPHGLHDALLLKDMDRASARIVQAIRDGEPMAVYGDYDVDGVTAVTLLRQAVQAMGGQIEPYIPHREHEGYGLNMAAIDHLAARGIRLLITVDCGITNTDEVAHACQQGLDVIVTDHHQPPPELPPALAIINPKQPGCAYPYKHLVGVGIAFKLVQALFKQGLRPEGLRARDLLDVVALGTVADQGPLYGENRLLVQKGLEALRQTSRPGLRALITAAGLSPHTVDSTAIAFMLGPRINAAGRMDTALNAYQLLWTDDPEEAHTLANALNQANRERQSKTRTAYELAALQYEVLCRQCTEAGEDLPRVILLSHSDYPRGLVGLVASRMVEHWHRPTILVSEDDEGMAHGSARSFAGFNIFQALNSCKDLFTRFGGHSLAAGFAMESSRLPDLEAHLHQYAAEHLSDDMLLPRLDLDAEVPLGSLNWPLFHALAWLEPFGQANPQPVLLSRNVHVAEARVLGDGSHLRLRLIDATWPTQAAPIEAVAFGLGHLAEPLRKHPQIDIAYTLEANTWNGNTSLQVNIKDLRRARGQVSPTINGQ